MGASSTRPQTLVPRNVEGRRVKERGETVGLNRAFPEVEDSAELSD